MSDIEYLPHLWIPDEEVEHLEKQPRGFSEDRGLDFSVHGETLSSGLKSVVEAYSHLENNSLSEEDIVIFQMILPEGEDIYAKRDICEKEGLKINAVKDSRHATVSASKRMFDRLNDRVGNYRNSGSLKHFQYVEGFKPVSFEEKQASSLKRYLEEKKDSLSIDVQMMFTPNLDEDIQERAASRLTEWISSVNEQKLLKRYSLSDGTTVIRADLPIKELKSISDDPVIYRVERTGFFHSGASAISIDNILGKSLEPGIDPDRLPVVAVLDNGVEFPPNMANLVPVHWKASGVSGRGDGHGTAVASKVVFSHIGPQMFDQYLVARAKVIDCDLYGSENDIAQEEMAKRIEEAVVAFKDDVRIYNFSSNIDRAIEGDELSILGYHLDNLMKKYHVKFVISAGNHDLASKGKTLEEIMDDTDARIAEPADSMLGITVGAIAGITGPNLFSGVDELTAYTRIGPGFAGFYKPDLVAHGGNVDTNLQVFRDDPYSHVLIPGGIVGADVGTSYTAPVVAGDLAEVSALIPGESILLAQAMLYNGAKPLWNPDSITKDEAILNGYHYGRGLSSPKNCMFSTPYRVSFLRSGSLKKNTKEHVRFLMPQLQAQTRGRNTTRITVTCITDSPIDKNKGEQYLGACITASLHKPENKSGKKNSANPNNSDNRDKWETCNHFTNVFSRFDSGMWEVWLDLFTKWEIDDDVEIPYHLVITIDDLTRTNDIYQAIIQESAGRFEPMGTIRIPVS